MSAVRGEADASSSTDSSARLDLEGSQNISADSASNREEGRIPANLHDVTCVSENVSEDEGGAGELIGSVDIVSVTYAPTVHSCC